MFLFEKRFVGWFSFGALPLQDTSQKWRFYRVAGGTASESSRLR